MSLRVLRRRGDECGRKGKAVYEKGLSAKHNRIAAGGDSIYARKGGGVPDTERAQATRLNENGWESTEGQADNSTDLSREFEDGSESEGA